MSTVRGKRTILSVPNGRKLSSVVMAAHELKAPLSLIRQLSLGLETNNIKSSENQRIVEQIVLTSERALRLTSDLTKSIKLDNALFKLEPINAQRLCEDVVRDMTPLFKANDKEIKIEKKRRSMLLIANSDLLRRILMNFSDNALRYSEGKNVVEIKVGSISKGEIIRVGIRDYGPALSSRALKAIKNKDLISNAETASRPLSSGLGIYISGQFAEAMNGQIGAIRHRDGTTFYVDLQASRQLRLL